MPERLMPPIHPGEILAEEFMKPLGFSMNRLSLDLHVPVMNAQRRNKRIISTTVARREPGGEASGISGTTHHPLH